MIETGDKGNVIATGVDLVVEGVLGEKETLTDGESVLDETSAVFEEEASLDRCSG